jgi:hypothetical protein
MMVAARTASRGLSTAELDNIRAALAGGRKPKVVFTQAAGQIAGQQGQVVELTDPALSEEWVVVRFGRDELPFSPTDLEIAPRGAPAKRMPRKQEPPIIAVPTPREEITVTRPAPAKTAAAPAADGKTTVPSKAAPAPTPPAAPQKAAPEPAAGAEQPARPAKAPARKAARTKPPAALTVTLAYADGEWTVAAQQGSRHLAKPYLIKATEALKMVGMLDVPGVQEAVEEIVSAARAQAEAEAERLRAELADIEARLAELREAR